MIDLVLFLLCFDSWIRLQHLSINQYVLTFWHFLLFITLSKMYWFRNRVFWKQFWLIKIWASVWICWIQNVVVEGNRTLKVTVRNVLFLKKKPICFYLLLENVWGFLMCSFEFLHCSKWRVEEYDLPKCGHTSVAYTRLIFYSERKRWFTSNCFVF